MERVDALASQPHYEAHIAPIWEALPEHLRGTFARGRERLGRGRAPVIVAGIPDYARVPGRPVVFVEHGAGQSYSNGHAAYSGGNGRDRTVLFVCPSETVARRNLERYPQARAVAVGCPALDALHAERPEPGTAVAVGFHWDAHVAPESRSAFAHYRRVLPDLARGFELIGTAHPRVAGPMRVFWERCGVEFVADFAEVCRRSRALVADNTSALYEYASLDRPVVVLNAPWYRREVSHGLRFWDWADIGVQVSEPAELPGAVESALTDTSAVAARRREIVAQVYAACDGRAAQRAARAIEELTP